MINSRQLFEQFMGNQSQGGAGPQAGRNDLLKGAAAGGMIGLLLGNKKARKFAGGLVGYGGAAAAGALAFKAYQNWQQGRAPATAPVANQQDLQRVDPRFLPPAQPVAAGQEDFGLTLISAMISAAHADGHIDSQEQARIFDQVEKLGLDAEAKAFVFDRLRKPVDIQHLAGQVQGIEQASEVYLVARLAIDPDHPAERAWLEVLAHRLSLPGELVAHLEHQVTGA